MIRTEDLNTERGLEGVGEVATEPSALTRIEGTFFPVLIYACKMAFVLSQKDLRSLQRQGQRKPRGGWTAPPFSEDPACPDNYC